MTTRSAWKIQHALITRRSVNLKTALLKTWRDWIGKEYNRFYFCPCESDILLPSQCFWLHSLHSAGLAAKVISLTFRTNIYLHLSWDELVLKKRVFDECSAHSNAVLDDSLITVDTTSLDQRAGKEVTRVTKFKNCVIHSYLFSHQWRNSCIPVTFFGWLANILKSSFQSLNLLWWNSQIIHFICLNPQEIFAKLQIKSWRSLLAKSTGKVNMISFVT